MLTKEELLELIRDIESSRAERTVSVNDTDKFCEAVCAFANDMPDSKQNGYLLVGVHDDGRLSGLKATDSLLKNLAAIRSDRDYRSTGPTMFYQYADRIELLNSGGLYGRVNRENFPDENDYRNPIIADAMRTLGYVNRFGRGIGRVKVELVDNGNGEPSFDTAQIGSFRVSVGLTKYALVAGDATLPVESSQRLAESAESRNQTKERMGKSEEISGESVPVSSESTPRGQESTPRSQESTPRDQESVPSGLESSPSREQIAAWAQAVLPDGIRSDGLRNMVKVLVIVGQNKFATTDSIASEIGITQRGVKKITAALQKLGFLRHDGPAFGGHWELVGFEP